MVDCLPFSLDKFSDCIFGGFAGLCFEDFFKSFGLVDFRGVGCVLRDNVGAMEGEMESSVKLGCQKLLGFKLVNVH